MTTDYDPTTTAGPDYAAMLAAEIHTAHDRGVPPEDIARALSAGCLAVAERFAEPVGRGEVYETLVAIADDLDAIASML